MTQWKKLQDICPWKEDKITSMIQHYSILQQVGDDGVDIRNNLVQQI